MVSQFAVTGTSPIEGLKAGTGALTTLLEGLTTLLPPFSALDFSRRCVQLHPLKLS